MTAVETGSTGRGGGRLLGRLAAWWDGEPEVDAPPPHSRTIAPPLPAPPAPAADLRSWTVDRIEAAQALYGQGWLAPGGEAFYGELIKPLSLDASQSVVIHGAALGAAARLVARETEAWVDALEERPAVAAEAARQIKASGAAKKVVVIANAPQNAPIKPRSRNAVIAFESLHRATDSEASLASLRSMLRPGGQFLLTDFTRKGEPDGALLRWARTAEVEPSLQSPEGLRTMLERQDLEVRVFEDRSESFCRAAVGALQELLKRVEREPVPSRMRARLVWEIEALTHLLRAFESGSLGYARAYATAPTPRILR